MVPDIAIDRNPNEVARWPEYLQSMALPELPDQGRYAFSVSSACNNWATYGHGLEVARVGSHRYSYFIFLSSAMRGPFVPVYLQVPTEHASPYLHWRQQHVSSSETLRVVPRLPLSPSSVCRGKRTGRTCFSLR